jgi:hypothetical protein
LGVDVLIGQNFTELFDVEYRKTGNILTFNDRGASVNTLTTAEVNVGIEGSEAIADLLDVLDEFPECKAGNVSEMGGSHYVGGNVHHPDVRQTDQPSAAVIFRLRTKRDQTNSRGPSGQRDYPGIPISLREPRNSYNKEEW